MEEFRKMRRFKQALPEEECIRLLKELPRGVLAMHGENGYPYAIPLDQYYNEEDGKLYFHCAKEGLKLDLLKKDSKACFTIMDEGYVKEGEWALNIKSVVCLGHVDTVTDQEKILDMVRKLAEKFYPTKESIEEEIAKSGARTNMLAMTIDRISGKLVNES